MLSALLLPLVVGIIVASGCYLVLRFLPETAEEIYPTRFDRVGTEATVLQVAPTSSKGTSTGRVRVSGESWRAVFLETKPNIGDTLVVTKREGLTLSCLSAVSEAVSEPQDETGSSASPLPRIGLGFGAAAATAVLCLVVLLASFAYIGLPAAAAPAAIGLFAPPIALLIIILVSSLTKPEQSGITVRSLRKVLGASCGLIAFEFLYVGVSGGIAAFCAVLFLAVLDPVLRDFLAAFAWGIGMVGFGDG